MKIRAVTAELFHVDRQTDRHDEANSGFSQFCEKRPKSEYTEQLPFFFCYWGENFVCCRKLR